MTVITERSVCSEQTEMIPSGSDGIAAASQVQKRAAIGRLPKSLIQRCELEKRSRGQGGDSVQYLPLDLSMSKSTYMSDYFGKIFCRIFFISFSVRMRSSDHGQGLHT